MSTRPDLDREQPLASGQWSVVPAASTAGFAVRELGLHTVGGSFPVVDGTVEVDGSGRPVSVRATLDARGVATGNPKRDRDLAGPRFLAADEWPTLSFTSQQVSGDGPEWTVVGTLQGRDAQSPLTLAVRLVGERPDGSRQVVATGTADRRKAGVRTLPVVIGRTVRISLDVTLTPPGH
jgi:polyisoprenoid-binding protein YceI